MNGFISRATNTILYKSMNYFAYTRLEKKKEIRNETYTCKLQAGHAPLLPSHKYFKIIREVDTQVTQLSRLLLILTYS